MWKENGYWLMMERYGKSTRLAEREDKEHELDRWAKLFYASTWEEFRMISAENKYMEEAGKTLFMLNGDDRSANSVRRVRTTAGRGRV